MSSPPGTDLVLEEAKTWLEQKNVTVAEPHSVRRDYQQEFELKIKFKLDIQKKWWGLINDELDLPSLFKFDSIYDCYKNDRTDEVVRRIITNSDGSSKIYIDWNELDDISPDIGPGTTPCYIEFKLLEGDIEDYLYRREAGPEEEHHYSFHLDSDSPLEKINSLIHRYPLDASKPAPDDLATSIRYEIGDQWDNPDKITYVDKKEYDFENGSYGAPTPEKERYLQIEISNIDEDSFKQKIDIEEHEIDW